MNRNLYIDSSIAKKSQTARSCVSVAKAKYSAVIRFVSTHHPVKRTLPSTITPRRLIKHTVADVFATVDVLYACGLLLVSSNQKNIYSKMCFCNSFLN